MKPEKLIFLCVIVLLAVVLIVVKIGARTQGAKLSVPQPEQTTLAAQTSNEGSVTVTATPETVSEDKKRFSFRVVFDTHTGSLDEDVTKIVNLNDDRQNTLEPLSWQGDPPGGHHKEGILQFPDFQEKPQSVTLLVRGIGGIAERRFVWIIK